MMARCYNDGIREDVFRRSGTCVGYDGGRGRKGVERGALPSAAAPRRDASRQERGFEWGGGQPRVVHDDRVVRGVEEVYSRDGDGDARVWRGREIGTGNARVRGAGLTSPLRTPGIVGFMDRGFDLSTPLS